MFFKSDGMTDKTQARKTGVPVKTVTKANSTGYTLMCFSYLLLFEQHS
jgi:hypothetical protein